MDSTPSPLGEGDASDLAWLDARADESLRTLHSLRAQLDEGLTAIRATIASGESVPELGDLAERVYAAQKVAMAAKTARDDAYKAQAALLEPSAPVFYSLAERRQWINVLIDQRHDALTRMQNAEAELDKLPPVPVLPRDASDAEVLAILEADEPFINQRVELIVVEQQARKDLNAAMAALERIPTGDE